MKKLIPAMCLLLISAMMLGTSTYAWFTMNDTVTATGMQVKATSSGGLLIATYNSGLDGDARYGAGFKASATALITDVTTLTPSSTTNATTWFTGTAASVDNYAKNSDDYVNITSTASGTYYLVNHFAVSTSGGVLDDTKDLVISAVTANKNTIAGETTDSGDLNKAIRIAIVVTDASDSSNTSTKIFAPKYDSATPATCAYTWTGVQATSGATATTTVSGYANLANGVTVAALDTVPAMSYVDVYVYYEGEDENCRSNNTVNGIDTLTVEISLTTADH